MINYIQHRLKLWLQRFSRSRRFYNAGEWHVHATSSLFTEQVVGRDHCQYLCLDLRHLPASKRKDSLKYQILSHSPWAAAGYQAVWHKGYAQLWLWPELSQDGGSSVSYAEAVFWQPPDADGMHLYKCAVGYDLQYWRNGCLQSSQWFAIQPSVAQQQWFARSQGLRPLDALQAQLPQLLSQPWSSARVNPLQGLMRQPGGVLRWGAFAFILIASLQVSALIQWNWQGGSYQKQRQLMEQQLAEVLDQRTIARDALTQIQQLQPLLEALSPLHVQQLLTERLASVTEFEVINWSRQDLQAELTIETPGDSALVMVDALRGPGIVDVQVQPGSRANQYRLVMQLQPPLPVPAGRVDEN